MPPRFAALAEVMAQHNDARAMLLLGKAALGARLPLDHYAFPTIGLPDYTPDRAADRAGASSMPLRARKAAFNQRTVSSAKAMGLMQVTPAAGKYIASRIQGRVSTRSACSAISSTTCSSARPSSAMCIADYRGSYILTFAAYNAGRGRVKEWIAKYGDPRDPKVDPIDWVERIPFSETRNYVQRVLENLQVYRVRFGGGSKLLIEADLHRGAARN